MERAKSKIKEILVWSEKYTKTDMIYLTSGVFWVGISKVFTFLFSFLLMLAFAHFTSKETFGSYQYILTILGITSVASLPGVNIALTKSIAQGKEGTLKRVLKTRTTWSLVGSVVIFCIALWYFYKSNIVLGITLVIAGVGFPFFQSFDSFEYFWNGKKNFKRSTLYGTLSTIIPVFFLIIAMLLSDNLIVIVAVFMFSNSLARYFFIKKTLKQVANQKIDEGVIKLGKKLTIVQGIEIISSYIDKIFIWQFLGAVAVAIYSFAQIPIFKIQQLAPIQALSLPKLSEGVVQEDKSIIIKSFLKLFIIMIPIALLFIVFIPILYKVFIPQYLDAIPYVRALGSLLALMPFTYLTTAMIAGSGGHKVMKIQIVTFIARMTLFFALILKYGIWGIIYATIITEVLKSFLTLYFFLKNK